MSDRSEADCVSNDLVERVAREFCASDGADPCEVVCDMCLHRAGPVVAACMEEAASYCEMKAKHYWGDGRDCCDAGLQQTAAAIRALKEEK